MCPGAGQPYKEQSGQGAQHVDETWLEHVWSATYAQPEREREQPERDCGRLAKRDQPAWLDELIPLSTEPRDGAAG